MPVRWISQLWYYTIFLQDDSIGKNWDMDKQYLPVLFLITACQSQVSQNKKLRERERELSGFLMEIRDNSRNLMF